MFPHKDEAPFKAVLYGLEVYNAEQVKQMMDECPELLIKPRHVVRMTRFDRVKNEQVNTRLIPGRHDAPAGGRNKVLR